MSTGPEHPDPQGDAGADAIDADGADEVRSDAAATSDVVENTDEEDTDPELDDYGPPFVTRSFGGELVWAKGAQYTCKILRVRAGENVVVSTQGRTDMIAMLTGGRGVLEVRTGDATDRVELLPASPVSIRPGKDYRLLALTEVELYTAYSPAS